jgi:hypothetical protein
MPLDRLGPAGKGESLHDLSCKNLILLLLPTGTLTTRRQVGPRLEERVLMIRGARVGVGVKKRVAKGAIKDRLAIPIPNMSI